ncbi:MAG: class I SAM-dependent methyltransferase [Dysgonamonadaceae bacterium]|jgi:SAM-dependent methyltransferase|nr:class I SAM-dependent methyltransferase [Dysgonamonadaceae bacterium]
MVFDHYAHYYNLLYLDKDYSGETAYVHSLIQRFYTKPVKGLLDIGCGTGTHASYLAQKGYAITGIDLSQEMINSALEKNIPQAHFQVANATDFKLSHSFEVITSLFHVVSYLTTNDDLQNMFDQVSNHLMSGGLFIFDFWYAPAVLTERPSVRIKRLEDADIQVTRIGEPVLKVNENTVDVHFELLIEDKHTHQLTRVKEVHLMRYFSLPEIEKFLQCAGMKLVYSREWMTEKEPSEATWGVCCVAVKSEK